MPQRPRNLTTVECGVEHYSGRYATEPQYRVPFYRSEYFALWAHVINALPERPSILELGCGAGQLAAFLWCCGFREYTGVDFSDEAIQIARIQASGSKFVVGSVYDENVYLWLHPRMNTIIACEVLEHVDDERVMRRIPPGTTVLFTVPNFGDKTHLRCFLSAGEVRERYERFFEKSFSVSDPIGMTGVKAPGAACFFAKGVKRC